MISTTSWLVVQWLICIQGRLSPPEYDCNSGQATNGWIASMNKNGILQVDIMLVPANYNMIYYMI